MPKTTTTKEISTSLIKDPVAPIRKDITLESVADLAKSIKEVGLIEPIVVRKSNGQFEVIAGHRRLLASRLAKLTKIPCVVKEATDAETDIMKLHENIYRQDVNPIEEGHYFKYLQRNYEATYKEIAESIGKSEQYVGDRIRILEYPEDIKQSIAAGELSFAVAKELAKIDSEPVRKEYTEHAKNGGATSDVVSKWRRDYQVRKTYKKAEAQNKPEPKQKPEEVEPIHKCLLCGGKADPANDVMVWIHWDCQQEYKKAMNKQG